MTSFARMALGTILMAGSVPFAPAFAGPCSDQIAQLSRTLSDAPQLGPSSTGTLAGATPQAGLKPADTAAAAKTADAADGTSAKGKMSGEAGMKEMNAASAHVATSAQDVRRQQAGLPTMAADPTAKLPASDERMSQAKIALERARALDGQGDASCKAATDQVQKLMQG